MRAKSVATEDNTHSQLVKIHFVPKFLRPAPVWPCGSVSGATLIHSGGHGFNSHYHPGQRFFSVLGQNMFLMPLISEDS